MAATRTRHRRRLRRSQVIRLLSQAATGHEIARKELLAEYADLMRTIAEDHRLPPEVVRDVVQTTFAALLTSVRRGEPPDNVGVWLAHSARRTSLLLRATVSGPEPVVDHHLATRLVEHAAPDAPTNDPRLQHVVAQEFRRLTPSSQTLLRLLMHDPPRSYAEISAALDIPTGSIGPTRQRSLAVLRAAVEREMLR